VILKIEISNFIKLALFLADAYWLFSVPSDWEESHPVSRTRTDCLSPHYSVTEAANNTPFALDDLLVLLLYVGSV